MAKKVAQKKKSSGKGKYDQFKELLEKERARLAGDIGHIKDDHLQKSQKDMSGELSGYSIHIADMSGDDYDRGVALGIVTQEQELLYLVEEALKRIEDGSFGICEVCEKPISTRRLEAVPYATLCIQCQGDQEKRKKA